jgi:hypothetical protein
MNTKNIKYIVLVVILAALLVSATTVVADATAEQAVLELGESVSPLPDDQINNMDSRDPGGPPINVQLVW